jgi:CRP/FNR family transcriptional regulator, cyclic AMP receptor protein
VKSANVRRTGKSKKAASATAPRFNSKSFLASLGSGHSSVKYRPKQTVFRQGDAADAVYYIQKGKIHLSVMSAYGRKAIIARLGPGEFFGEACLAGQTLYMGSAVATAESTVARIDKETMFRVLHNQPKLSEIFISFLLSRNIRIKADLIEQLFNSSERRLARLLLLLANFGKEGKMEKVIPKISLETLATRVGTTRARIDFFMDKFRKLGFIEYGNDMQASDGLTIHTSLVNVIVHD